MPCTIAHISDLHFCDNKIADEVRSLLEEFRQLGIPIELTFANENVVRALSTAINKMDPEVICITGDITTLGDPKSFDKAREFIDTIATRPKGARDVITIPGNHDALAAHLHQLKDRLHSWATMIAEKHTYRSRAARFCIPRQFLDLLARCDSLLTQLSPQDNSWLANYHAFAAKNKSHYHDRPFSCDDIAIIPFNSVSRVPLWINVGAGDEEEIRQFRAMVSRTNGDSIRMVAIHHNPYSSPSVVEPNIVHAYNCTPAASKLMKLFQDDGIDIVLHGHQHLRTELEIDFLEGNHGDLLVLGTGCASVPNGEFNLIRIENRFQISIATVHYRDREYILDDVQWRSHVLKPRTTRDTITIHAREEVEKFRGRDPQLDRDRDFHDLYEKPADSLMIIGTALRTLSTTRIDQIMNLLRNGCTISILMVKFPEVPGDIDNREVDSLKLFYEKHLYYTGFLEEIDRSNERLAEFEQEARSLKSGELILKRTTVVPFSAAIRNDKMIDAEMVIEPLPVGSWAKLRKEDSPARIWLTKRDDSGMFHYYKKMADDLWESGRQD